MTTAPIDPDLTTDYLGLELRSPVVASSSPLTGHLDGLRALEEAGAGAVVLPSLFEEQLTHDAVVLDAMLSTVHESFAEATSFFPELYEEDPAATRHVRLVEDAVAALSVPVVASLNGTSPGGWIHHARQFEAAGAAALELNVYRVAADPEVSGSALEDETVDLVAAVCAEVDLPVAVKLSPYWSSVANLAARLDAAGVAGLVLFNRFYQPELDLDTMRVEPHLALSTPHELRLPLRWIGLLRGRVACSLAATSGVHSGLDVVRALLCGADIAMTASAVLHQGPGHVRELLDELLHWMAEHDYASVRQMTGSAAALTGPDPAAFERANYLRTLASWP